MRDALKGRCCVNRGLTHCGPLLSKTQCFRPPVLFHFSAMPAKGLSCFAGFGIVFCRNISPHHYRAQNSPRLCKTARQTVLLKYEDSSLAAITEHFQLLPLEIVPLSSSLVSAFVIPIRHFCTFIVYPFSLSGSLRFANVLSLCWILGHFLRTVPCYGLSLRWQLTCAQWLLISLVMYFNSALPPPSPNLPLFFSHSQSSFYGLNRLTLTCVVILVRGSVSPPLGRCFSCADPTS